VNATTGLENRIVDRNGHFRAAECQSGFGGLAGRRAPKLVHKLVFSMPAGTPADKVLLATQGFCREQLALKHRYVMALHTDEPHLHVHVVIKAISEQGERLNIRKATLRQWREEFATQLRRVGVAANATPRFVRGETRRELERRWVVTSESLRSQGQTALAEQTRHFVRNLPPARTEREWLLAALVEQVQADQRLERANDKARSR